jgi:tetratricopeptide (TPR) repeat protein
MIRAIEPELEEGLALTGAPATGRALLVSGGSPGRQFGVPSSQYPPPIWWPASAVRPVGLAAFLMSEGDKTGRMAMKTSTPTKSLARIYSSSMGLIAPSRQVAPGESSGGLAGAFLGRLSLRASRENLRRLGTHLVALARQARLLRQTEVVEWTSQALLALPLPSEFQLMAHYYEAYCQQQAGETEASRITLTKVADEAPPGYKERAILELGGSLLRSGDFQASAPYFVEAARAARTTDFLVHIEAFRNLAIVRSVDGDHHGALRDLERLHPIIKSLSRHYPSLYCTYLNSLAVEMSQLGRNREAKQIIGKLLALPIAERNPEWRETAEQIALNEARGVSCPLTFAIWSPTDAASTPEAFPAPITSRAPVATNPGIGASSADDRSSAAVPADSVAETAPTLRQRSRVFRLCSIDWGVASSKIQPEVASSISAANLQTAFAPILGGCLPRRSREGRPARRVRNRQLESVPVPGEYPRFPLPRAPTDPT